MRRGADRDRGATVADDGLPLHRLPADERERLFAEFVNVRPTMLDDASWCSPFVETYLKEWLPRARTPAVHGYPEFPPMEGFERLMAEFATQGQAGAPASRPVDATARPFGACIGSWREDYAMPDPQRRLAGLFAAIVLAVAVRAMREGGPGLGAATLIGALAGFALYHAAFGFTSGWRRFIRERRSAGLANQLLLVGMTTIVAIPLIAYGQAIGVDAGGFVFPVGIAVIAGAFAFGLGMQLGGGCGSGTLFTVGGGSTRMVVTLGFFILGGVLATWHWAFWQALPALPAIDLAVTRLGPPGALVSTLAVLVALWTLVRAAERKRHGAIDANRPTGSLWRGPWSLVAGAVALTLVGALTLVVLGRPWGITSGLTLWGAQIANAIGVPIGTWPYWRDAMGSVEGSIFADGTSVMNLGLILGAALAASLAGRFAPRLNLTPRDVATAMAGGLLMGYGARLAYGCNIGALLGGIASGSLHGWVWFASAFAGSIAGVRVRAMIGMDPPVANPRATARPALGTPL